VLILYKMKLSLARLSSVLLLGQLGAAKFHGLNAFKRAEKPIEKRQTRTPAVAPQPHLRKRASPFYTNKTQRRSSLVNGGWKQTLTLDSFLGQRDCSSGR
jgi:hypothetical protein